MVTPPDKKQKNRDSLAKETVDGGLSVLALTSPVDAKRGAQRKEYRVHVVAHVPRNGGIAKLAELLLERFAHALEQPFVSDFIDACSSSRDEEPLRPHLYALNRLLQWDSANRPVNKDPAQLPAGVVRFQALGIWNAQAWFDERGHIGRFPRLLVLVKILASSAADDDELAAMLARALGEGTHRTEAGKVLTRLRKELREDRVNRYGSGLDAISKLTLPLKNVLHS
jgi:hypothetical protein